MFGFLKKRPDHKNDREELTRFSLVGGGDHFFKEGDVIGSYEHQAFKRHMKNKVTAKQLAKTLRQFADDVERGEFGA